jgi:hypothetical protein
MREGMLELRENALQQNVAQYVLDMGPSFKRVLREYMNLVGDPTCRVFRYEDVILEKRRFMEEICQFFDWRLSPAQADAILGWADILPDTERPTEFIRKVTPGDHRDKLSPKVIQRLDRMFAEEMAHFGYAGAAGDNRVWAP